jgi:ubiquinone/menaquinone biosynthesis C-methylase UbiE
MAADSVVDEMRSDWDERARDDANYYVAFGRRNQSEEEFFASASDQVRLFETELKRLPAAFWKTASALEIGCGPGRLLHPLSRHFAAIHGLDISEGMLRRAAANLRDIFNVTLHHAQNSTLSDFADSSIGFVYSYAVFQHIPSRGIVFGYLAEAVRVLQPGGLFAFQINGLPDHGHVPTTWEGCRVKAEELSVFSQKQGMLLLSLTDKDTQYMWVTLQKPFAAPTNPITPRTAIFNVTNAYTGEPVVPSGGRFGAASVWMTGLPDEADLLTLSARVDGVPAYCCYVSPPTNGRRFLDVLMPPGTRTGLVPIDLQWRGDKLGETALVRIIPPGPKIPSVSYIADGVNLLSVNRIESGCAKLVMDEVTDPAVLHISLNGERIAYDWFCINPLHERYEFNFQLPPSTTPGKHLLALQVGGRQFPPIPIEVAP